TDDLPLYNLPALLAAGEGRTVFVTEGEPACTALEEALHLCAVATYGADVIPSDEELTRLKGYDVVLWPDHDEPGHHHMLAIAARLGALSIGARWLHWPDAPAHGDAADFVVIGGTAERLATLVSDVPKDDELCNAEAADDLKPSSAAPFPLKVLPPAYRR